MSVGTLTIALAPGFESIGLFAPIVVVVNRLCQGFSTGVELGRVFVYLSEIATPRHRGFYVSWQSASQQVAVAFAGVLGYSLAHLLTPYDLQAWGWRIPLIVGWLIIPFIYMIRRTLQETEEFTARKHHSTPAILTYLIHATGNRAIPGVRLSLAAAVAPIAVFMTRHSQPQTPLRRE